MSEPIKKGDFVRVKSTGFVGQVLDNQTKQKTRLIHAFGMAEESGSVYSDDLVKIDKDTFEKEKSDIYEKYNVKSYRQWSSKEIEFQENKKRKMNRL